MLYYYLNSKDTRNWLPNPVGYSQTLSFYKFLLMFGIIEHSSHLKILYCLDLYNSTLSGFSFPLSHCHSHPINISSWYAMLILPLLLLVPFLFYFCPLFLSFTWPQLPSICKWLSTNFPLILVSWALDAYMYSFAYRVSSWPYLIQTSMSTLKKLSSFDSLTHFILPRSAWFPKKKILAIS